jgi:hypothetical protein
MQVSCTITGPNGQKLEITPTTFNEQQLVNANPLEVTRDHPDGPLKELLQQIEQVQIQSNFHLSEIIKENQKVSKQRIEGLF